MGDLEGSESGSDPSRAAGTMAAQDAAARAIEAGVDPVDALADYDDRVSLRCVDDQRADICGGVIELRESLSGTGDPIARCTLHWSQRLTLQDQHNRRYPERQPADFDPLYAGESWDEHD